MVCYVHDTQPVEAATNISDSSLELGRGGATGGSGKGVGSLVLSMLVRQVAETDSGKGRSIQVRDRHKHEQETRCPSCQLKTQADGVPSAWNSRGVKEAQLRTNHELGGKTTVTIDKGVKSLSSGKSTKGGPITPRLSQPRLQVFLQPTAWIRAFVQPQGRARTPSTLSCGIRKKKQDESGPACAKVELMGSMCNLSGRRCHAGHYSRTRIDRQEKESKRPPEVRNVVKGGGQKKADGPLARGS